MKSERTTSLSTRLCVNWNCKVQDITPDKWRRKFLSRKNNTCSVETVLMVILSALSQQPMNSASHVSVPSSETEIGRNDLKGKLGSWLLHSLFSHNPLLHRKWSLLKYFLCEANNAILYLQIEKHAVQRQAYSRRRQCFSLLHVLCWRIEKEKRSFSRYPRGRFPVKWNSSQVGAVQRWTKCLFWSGCQQKVRQHLLVLQGQVSRLQRRVFSLHPKTCSQSEGLWLQLSSSCKQYSYFVLQQDKWCLL